MVTTITPWRSKLTPIKNGEEVEQSIANRFPNELRDRTQHLKDRLDALEDGQALFLRNAALSSETKVGHFVYWNAEFLRYEPTLAKVIFDPELDAQVVAPSSYAAGMVVSKAGATMGDIVQMGFINGGFDFTNTIGSPGTTANEAGAYYLSGTEAGMLTKQKPPVGIFAMILRGDGSAHIQPAPREVLEDHIHFALDLFAVPAGTIECTDPHNKYEFITPDPNVPGWLPADHAVFGGKAPTDAVLGYNLAQHPELERVWPPLPLDAAFVERDGVGEDPARYIVDHTTLWWTNDCYGKAPWAPEILSCGTPISSSSSSPSAEGPAESLRECDSGPTLEQMGFVRGDPFNRRLRLYFTKLVAKTSNPQVTSLKAAPGSPITIVSCDGETPASTGDLQLDADLSLNIEAGEPGFQALKDIDGLTFKRGPVMEAIQPGTNVEITPVEGASNVDEDGFVDGKAVINAVLPGSEQQEGAITLVALDKAREDVVSDIFMLTLPAGIESGLRGKIDVPFSGLVANPQMELRFWIFAAVEGVLPVLPLGVRRLARPAPNPCTKLAIPSSDTDIADLDPSVCATMLANTYVEVVSEPFTVAAGEQVHFRLGREATDSYTGKVGVLRMGFRIFAG